MFQSFENAYHHTVAELQLQDQYYKNLKNFVPDIESKKSQKLPIKMRENEKLFVTFK